MDRFKFYLHLYNKYSALQEVSEDGEQEFQSSASMRLSRPYKVHATEVDYKSDAQNIRQTLPRAKKSTEKGQQATEVGASLSQLDMSRARDVNEFNDMHNTYLEHRDILRGFYFSPQRAKQKRRYELQKR
ncbi:hypothetical protein RMATCC62417_13583 [Rhizopus microsporus]|nr:hypothetical protein RMATCC62417_13583 [Rhizopus microsporus]